MIPAGRVRALLAATLAPLGGCEFEPASGHVAAEADPARSAIRFTERRDGSGITFTDTHGRVGRAKRHLPELMGGGVGLIDHDADGDLDVFLAGGDPWTDGGHTDAQPCRLYRNDGAFRFADVTDAAGVDVRRDATAVAVGDVDGDGFDDLFVAAHGPNVLLRNRGDGTFEDASRAAGVDDALYATAAVFADFDDDGDLDLFVGNYFLWDDETVALSHAGGEFRGNPVIAGPRGFTGAPDILYKNRIVETGELRFEDVTLEAGLERSRSFALGALACDIDEDGDTDLYVANDSEANSLFINDGDMRLFDQAPTAGAALNAMGAAQAGMGIAAADLDSDGHLDLFVTNFSHDTNTVYRNVGRARFEDATRRLGLAKTSYLPLGFGCVAIDADLDGDTDVAVANGHVFPSMDDHAFSTSRYAQADQVFENLGDGRLRHVLAALGAPSPRAVSRGMAHGDLDGDGREDLVITTLNGPPSLLQNVSDAGACVVLRLKGSASHPNAVGARVEATVGDERGLRQLERQVVGGGSYMSSSSRDIVIGLGRGGAISELLVHWPSGHEQVVPPPGPDHLVIVTERDPTPILLPLLPRDSR